MQYSTEKIGMVRLALAGGATLFVVFLVCWIAALLPFFNATHAYLGLFASAAEPTSGVALVQGLGWSFVFGLLGGGLLALIYNLLGPRSRA